MLRKVCETFSQFSKNSMPVSAFKNISMLYVGMLCECYHHYFSFDFTFVGNKRKKRRKDVDEKHKTTEEISDDSRKFDINEFFDMAESALPITGMVCIACGGSDGCHGDDGGDGHGKDTFLDLNF